MDLQSYKQELASTLRGRSRACATPIGGSPGGGSPNGAETERAKSADNAKLLGRGTPTSDEHFSSSARQISPKFSAFLGEGGPRRGAKKFRNLTREFRDNRGQSAPRSKISTPHISPKWGAIPPIKICCYQGPQAYNQQWPVRGWRPPKGVNSKSRNRPKSQKKFGRLWGRPLSSLSLIHI